CIKAHTNYLGFTVPWLLLTASAAALPLPDNNLRMPRSLVLPACKQGASSRCLIIGLSGRESGVCVLRRMDSGYPPPASMLPWELLDGWNAIKKLLHPAVRVSDILPWQHQRIIKSFLFWKAPQKALKYINHMEPPQTSLEDMKLHLSVLLACGAITQAYEYQRKKQEMGFGNELLNHLFLGCQELRKMKDLMYLPLNSLESWALVRFLTESKDPRAQESLVIYHLLHCNFFEAAKVNEKLSRFLMNKIATIYESNIRERSIDREALVESLMAAVSNTEKCLAEEMKRLPSDAAKKDANLEVSQPLSVSIKCSAVKQMSYSDILQSLICKASPCASPRLKLR
ncbi:Protein ELYS, partial [Araneus ventricosus]